MNADTFNPVAVNDGAPSPSMSSPLLRFRGPSSDAVSTVAAVGKPSQLLTRLSRTQSIQTIASEATSIDGEAHKRVSDYFSIF